jgi:hypothetical protein
LPGDAAAVAPAPVGWIFGGAWVSVSDGGFIWVKVLVGVGVDDPACPLSDCVTHPAANNAATSITEARAITLVNVFICFPQEHVGQVQIKGNARICSRLHPNLFQIPKKRITPS